VKKEEVQKKTSKKSSARQPLEHREFKQSLAILESDPDSIKQFLAPFVSKVQYNVIAWLDDAMELEMEDIKPNLHFPFALLIQICWSKNVNKEWGCWRINSSGFNEKRVLYPPCAGYIQKLKTSLKFGLVAEMGC
jgi:hypothetical protein